MIVCCPKRVFFNKSAS